MQVTGTPASSVSLSDVIAEAATPNLADALVLSVYEDSDPQPLVDGAPLSTIGAISLPGTGHAGAWRLNETHTFRLVVAFPVAGPADNVYQGASTSFDLVWSRT